MDRIASVLLSFPPSQELKGDDDYHTAAKAHAKQLDQFQKNEPQLLANHAPQLLQHVNPAFNTISYAYLLSAIYNNDSKSPHLPVELAQCTAKFLLTFDPRQIRYAGAPFSSILGVVHAGQDFAPSVAVELLASALVRLDPTGSMFTSHHLPLAKLAYQSDCNILQAPPVISKSITFYPGMRGQTEKRPLCDTTLPSSAYISIESGLTARVTPAEVMEYDLVCGLIYLGQEDWASAAAAFERVVTFPTRDGGCSTIMTQAHNKWILTNLLLTGTLRTEPVGAHVSPSAQRSFGTLSKPYVELGKAFEKGAADGGAAALKAEADAGAAIWTGDQNAGLVRAVQAHYQCHHILRLREVYSKIGLEDIRTLTHSGETGKPLDTTSDVERLLRNMIARGTLAGTVDEGYLTFLPGGGEGSELTEERFAAEMERAAQKLAELAPAVRATDERLATSRDYVKHLAKEAKRAEDGKPSLSTWQDTMDVGMFDSQIEDEDIMTGLQPVGY